MKYVYIAGGIGLLLVVGLAGAFFLFTKSSDTPAGPIQSPFSFTGDTAAVAPKTLSLTLGDGTLVQTRDFTKEQQPEWAGEASGYLAAGGEQDAFIILYFGPDAPGGQGEFLVNINQEPLGDVRKRAEAALAARLELTPQELCKLVVSVRTAPGLSDTYGGYDLGLSFCPGAVALP